MPRIKSQIGLSIMEVITSVAIISLLTAISYTSWNAIVRKSRSSEVKISLAMAATSMNNYKTHCKSFHPDFNKIGAIPEGFDLYYDVGVKSDPSQTWRSCTSDIPEACGANCPERFSKICCQHNENPCEKECRLRTQASLTDSQFNTKVVATHFRECGKVKAENNTLVDRATATKTITPDHFCIFGASSSEPNDASSYNVWMITDQGDLLEIQ